MANTVASHATCPGRLGLELDRSGAGADRGDRRSAHLVSEAVAVEVGVAVIQGGGPAGSR